MPTYEYECEQCGEVIEVRTEKYDAPPPSCCKKCHNPWLKKLISRNVAVVFKGSGFYETDYKNKK